MEWPLITSISTFCENHALNVWRFTVRTAVHVYGTIWILLVSSLGHSPTSLSYQSWGSRRKSKFGLGQVNTKGCTFIKVVMNMGWLWTSLCRCLSPQRNGDPKEFAALLLCFLGRFYCLSWAAWLKTRTQQHCSGHSNTTVSEKAHVIRTSFTLVEERRANSLGY